MSTSVAQNFAGTNISYFCGYAQKRKKNNISDINFDVIIPLESHAPLCVSINSIAKFNTSEMLNPQKNVYTCKYM